MVTLKLFSLGAAYSLLFINSCSKQTASTEQLLTGHTWKAEEIRVQQSDDKTQYYLRGGKHNTIDYDSDSLKFNSDYTGTYYYDGALYSTQWHFTNKEKTKMAIEIHYHLSIIVYLENIHITSSSFKYSQYTKDLWPNYMASCTRTPNQ